MTAIKGMTWVYNEIYLNTSNPDIFVSEAGWDDNPWLYYASNQGLIKAEEVTRLMQARNQRLQDMGVPDLNLPALGQTMLELKVHYIKVYDEDDARTR